jgi:PBP1b-binding outer membrane lipoprotein LpoB
MTLTDINTGLSIWEDEKVIGKQGSNKSAAW